MQAQRIAVYLPVVFAVVAPVLQAQVVVEKAVSVQPEKKLAAPEVSQRFGVHAYSILRKGRVLSVELFGNDRTRQGTYTLDETKAPVEREERITIGNSTLTTRYRDDGDESSVLIYDGQDKATLTLDKENREWSGDAATAELIVKRQANAMALVESIQDDIDIRASAPGNPTQWSKRRGEVGSRPAACERPSASQATTLANDTVDPTYTGQPRITCAEIYYCRGWATDGRRSRACNLASQDAGSCCSNAICWGCCQYRACDCICGLTDLFCYCQVDGDSCTYTYPDV